MPFTPVTSPHDIDTVARLAREIWNEYYVSIIGQAQVDYMVEKFQSAPAMAGQIASGYEYFLISAEGAPVGYFAIQPEPAARRMFLGKLYLRYAARGRGLGAAAVEYIENECKSRGLSCLWLTVNKGNPAVAVYQRLGFRIMEPIVMDIGAGYVMDDYRMEKQL